MKWQREVLAKSKSMFSNTYLIVCYQLACLFSTDSHSIIIQYYVTLIHMLMQYLLVYLVESLQ